MKQILVVKDGMVIATHAPDQDVADGYPGCEVVAWVGPRVYPRPEDGREVIDPRTPEQQAADRATDARAAIVTRHATEQDVGVVLANGWRLRYTEAARRDYVELAELLSLGGDALPGLPMWVASDSQEQFLAPGQARAVLAEYAVLVAAERRRQFQELAELG